MSSALQSRVAGTLEAAYAALAEARAAHAAHLATVKAERRRLDERAGYVLGSMEAARRFLDPDVPPPVALLDGAGEPDGSLVPAGEDALADVVSRTRASLEAARSGLERRAEEDGRRLEAAVEAAESSVVERVAAYRAHYVPTLRVEAARVGASRSIVHLVRPRPDDAVLLSVLLAGRPPSRRDYLEDDAVDQTDGPVHLVISGPGLDARAVTEAGPDAEDAVARSGEGRLLPIRAHVPVLPPNLDWPRLRLRARGPILELESREEGEAYAHLVPGGHAELFLGFLVSLRVRGALEVDIDVA